MDTWTGDQSHQGQRALSFQDLGFGFCSSRLWLLVVIWLHKPCVPCHGSPTCASSMTLTASIISFQKLKINYLFIFICWVCVCRGRRTTWRSQFFLPIMWVPGIELIPSGLGASTFILWAISLALNSLLPIHMICSLQNLFHAFLGIAFYPMFLLFTRTQVLNQLINQSNELTELRPFHAFLMLCHVLLLI